MGSFYLETFSALPKISQVEGDGVACFHLHSCLLFTREWKAFGEHSGSQAVALLLAFIMNECVEWCEPLFGGSSFWWTENWRERKAAPGQTKTGVLGLGEAGGEVQ